MKPNLLFGSELEFFTVDGDSLEARDYWYVLKKSRYTDSHLSQEAVSSQLEIISSPSSCISSIYNELKTIVSEVSDILRKENAYLLPVSLYERGQFKPSECYKKNQLNRLGKNFVTYGLKIASDQINIGTSDNTNLFNVFNFFRSKIPLFYELSAASPFGKYNNCPSKRLEYYDKCFEEKLSYMTGIPPIMSSLEALNAELLSVSLDGNERTYYKYVRMKPCQSVSAEIRCIDKQPKLILYIALLTIAKGLYLEFINQGCISYPCNSDLDKQLLQSRKGKFTSLIKYIDMIRPLVKYLSNQEAFYLNYYLDYLKQGFTYEQIKNNINLRGEDSFYKSLIDNYLET